MMVTDRILAGLGACMAFSLLAACGGGGGANPETPEYEAYEYRDSVMHLLEAKATIINEMFREQRPLDEAVFAEAAQDLAALSNMMLDGFESSTLVPESRSKPEIWSNMADFESKADALIEGADALAAAAATGGFAAAQQYVQGTISSCGGCHRSYRAAEDDDDD